MRYLLDFEALGGRRPPLQSARFREDGWASPRIRRGQFRREHAQSQPAPGAPRCPAHSIASRPRRSRRTEIVSGRADRDQIRPCARIVVPTQTNRPAVAKVRIVNHAFVGAHGCAPSLLWSPLGRAIVRFATRASTDHHRIKTPTIYIPGTGNAMKLRYEREVTNWRQQPAGEC